MTDLLSVCSRVTFGNDTESFNLQDTLLINPALILDETENLYRVSIGTSKNNEEYKPLFNALDKHMPFVENMHFCVGGAKLTFKLAYITKTIRAYGTFYDIEATKQDVVYKESEIKLNESKTCTF